MAPHAHRRGHPDLVRRGPGRQHRQDRRLRARGGRAGAQVILPSELFQGPYFCTQAGRVVRHGASLARAPLRDRAAAAGARARRRHPDLDLRARGAALLQQPGDGRRRRRAPRRLPQEPHPRRARLPGEVLLPARRHRLQGVDDASRHARRRHLLGPVVPGGRARHGADGRRGAALSDRHRLGAARPDARHRTALAARDAGPRGLQRDPGGRAPTAPGSRTTTASASTSTARPSSPTTAATWSPSFGATTRACSSPPSTSTLDEPPRRLGLLPRPAADLYAKNLV